MSDLTVRGIKIENLEKRIAELEAELAMWQRMARDGAEHEVAGLERIEELLKCDATIKRLRARRCDGCKALDGCPVFLAAEDELCCCSDDFSCRLWRET